MVFKKNKIEYICNGRHTTPKPASIKTSFLQQKDSNRSLDVLGIFACIS